MSAELLIIGLSFIHVGVFLKWKKIEYVVLYVESLALLVAGLLGWVSSWIFFYPNDWERSLFALYSGQWYCPFQPIDLIFLALGLFASTGVLDFLTRFYGLERKSMLAVLPWTVVGQYRFLHEFAWTFQYWITMNVVAGHFSDIIPAPDALGGGMAWPVATLTHFYALTFTVFTIFNLVVLLTESKRKHEQRR